MPLEKLVLTPNVPVQISLKFPSGKIVEGRFGNQVFYTLAQPADHCMYLDMPAAAKINELEPAAGECFNICKRWTGKKTDSPVWDVWPAAEGEVKPVAAAAPRPQVIRPDTVEADLRRSIEHIQQQRASAPVPAVAPAPAARQPVVSYQPQNITAVPAVNGHAARPYESAAPSKTKLEDALKTAIAAAHAATLYAKEIGFPMPDDLSWEDLRALANCLIIQNGGGR